MSAGSDPETYVKLASEYAELQELATKIRALRATETELADLVSMRDDKGSDAEMRDLAASEIEGVEERIEGLKGEIRILLLPRDAADDKSVPVENSLVMFSALKAKGVPTELHIFEEGGHGFGLRGAAGKPVAAWPSLFETFAIVDATTRGGPAGATSILVYKVYLDGFVTLDLGSSAAQSVVLMALALFLTFAQFRFVERRVNYSV